VPSLNVLAARGAIALLRRVLPHIDAGSRSYIARMSTQDRFNPRALSLADFCTSAVYAWKNKQYDVSLNGEEGLLRRLGALHPRVVIDVGANVGEWTYAACRHLPETVVHAFEIAPSTAEVLRRTTAGNSRVVVNDFGLGDQNGSITIYASPESSTATSTLRDAIEVSAVEHGIHTIEEINAKIVTGDSYMRDQGLQRIDLLKIDVEGAEFSVLHGFSDAFARGTIDLVQFEYGKINLSTRHFLADFYKFFEDHGYLLGKLFPEGVAFKPYDIDDEDFVGPNFVACLKSRNDIVEALRCPVPALR
jgi:FkbM family methyltransferase